MKIAVHAAELDEERIDGTRVYLSELLKRLGRLGDEDEWYLYHRRKFNPHLTPPDFSNYYDVLIPGRLRWTQTRFVPAVRKLRPERIFFPIQSVPYGLPQGAQVIVTVHDLAFKYYPETFPWKDALKLNWYADRAVYRADKLIAITEATKRDLLRMYPRLTEEKIRVIHHGFDAGRFVPERQTGDSKVFEYYGIQSGQYVLYVGAIQPRKNLTTLLRAFEILKQTASEAKLVLTGGRAWLWEDVERLVREHPNQSGIVLTGNVSPEHLPALYRGARVFAYPSLYEGFGLPLLEAMASGVPVVVADNSSLPEVGGDAVLYHEATDAEALAGHLSSIWHDVDLAASLRAKGFEQIRQFSWDKTARETLEWIVG